MISSTQCLKAHSNYNGAIRIQGCMPSPDVCRGIPGVPEEMEMQYKAKHII